MSATEPIVTQIFVHPIKGLTPQRVDRAILEADLGIRGDRAFALMFEDAGKGDEAIVPWMPKKHFAVQNDWPGLAALECHYDASEDWLRVCHNGTEVLSARTQTDRDRINGFFSNYLATLTPTEKARHPHPSSVRLVGTHTGETRYPDRHPVHISIISQATLDAIGFAVGETIDVRRFRPNVLIDGVAAWEELNWVGREIILGEAKITISAPIGRCLNIEVHPDSGVRDMPLFSWLGQHFGHAKTGVVAKVIATGSLSVGDRLQLRSSLANKSAAL
ncbi:MOSC domain-containing protein [Oscillatoriales cyanobacterium LEGE 11467]|uniref:MOSC domain-containing protein n=1 Tax=Zarconia navalis LEGE 11467 TaxID=1828826 RepID=A0A928Z828_9CYAN|nr:MOSC N-terminal beta barrel domain-containing protein [Zarconia navalis]MBE9040283.1 MOSC domain-containing protein [Zarconia navalis LEGE 11467]